jgi:hypothetical protein
MAVGVLLPAFHLPLAGIVVSALLVGGTFMVITSFAMQEARARSGEHAAPLLARMTAGFAGGQLMGPVVVWMLGAVVPNAAAVLRDALMLAGLGLILSAVYLWRTVTVTATATGSHPGQAR